MVATKSTLPSTVILDEVPLVVGPNTGRNVPCLGCYRNLEPFKAKRKTWVYRVYKDILISVPPLLFRCKQCGWPICGPRCQGIGKPYGHTREECSILTETKSSRLLPLDDIPNLRPYYSAIAPLRCLILKTADPEAYKILMSMEAHNAIRKMIPEVWQGNQTLVVNRIRTDWGLDAFSESEIHTICGILEVSTFITNIWKLQTDLISKTE